MAFVTLRDDTAQIEAVLFPKLFETLQNLLVENKPVFIEGKTNLRDNVMSILIDSISETPPKNIPKFDFTIQVPAKTTKTQLMNLNRLLKDNPNGHRGLIIMPDGKKIALSYGVNYTSKLQSEIDKVLDLKTT
jgi:DNA polymerase-3 subunit alpha